VGWGWLGFFWFIPDYGPDFSVADVYRGWEKALTKLGHTVMAYNTNDRLSFYGHVRMPEHDKEACTHCEQVPTRQAVTSNEGIMTLAMDGLYKELYRFWPDVVFFVSGFYMTAPMLQVIRTRRHKIVILHTESPYQDDEQMMRGQFADLNLLNDPVNIAAWRDMDIPVAYMPHAYDPDVHFPAAKRDYEADFTFIGTMFRSRAEFFSKMDFADLDVAFGGAGWDTGLDDYPELIKPLLKYLGHPLGHCVDNDETARMYRAARVGINFYRREGESTYKGDGWAMGPREVEMAACGLFFLRDPRPESDEVFDGILPKFSSPAEASESLRWWLKNDSAREEMAGRAYERIAARTFDNNARAAAALMEEAGIL
jgi:spore maturation protein CgeB